MYKTKTFYSLIIFILIGFSPSLLFAQEEKSDCVLNLEQAQSKYNQGRIQDVESLIGDCLKEKGFDKAAQTQALKLLTLSYLFLEEPEKAEKTMLQLLSHNHLFTVNTAIDPSEFINLYNKFRHEPLYSIGILGGLVTSNPIVTKLNSTQDLNNSNKQQYAPLLGFRIAVNAEYKLKDNIYAVAGLGFTSIKFQKTHTPTNPISNISIDGNGFDGIELQTSVELPLLIQYHIMQTNKLTPYVALGVAPQLLLNASYPGETIKNTVGGSAPATTQTINLTQDRNSFNLYGVIAGGLKVRINEGFFNVQLRYSYGIFNSTKEESTLNPSNPNLLWDLSESSDVFRLQDLSIAIGYTFDFYKPKKLR